MSKEMTLVTEYSPLFLQESTGNWQQSSTITSEWRNLAGINGYWITESSLDLTGYLLQDLTVGFRRSFEQYSSNYHTTYSIQGTGGTVPFTTIQPSEFNVIEQIIISSVPITDAQMLTFVTSSPGFTPFRTSGDNGNFNREHIIHGHKINHLINTTFGGDQLQNTNLTAVFRFAYLLVGNDNYYSSLEPTAADTLYCYRVIYAPSPRSSPTATGLAGLSIPACRVILDAVTMKEDDIPYLMRMKRSYELANQV